MQVLVPITGSGADTKTGGLMCIVTLLIWKLVGLSRLLGTCGRDNFFSDMSWTWQVVSLFFRSRDVVSMQVLIGCARE
jgi:hypothetical protein